ncbi:helix-turn-helix domain-containing protein [Saccharopolyspora taberi]|uniref:Helix-turn-helix domain-containing protein n=1 Tax=Saccharopolyspora taberi TaxID=60895 RepID=A0ABN3VH80_9PSEU
MTATPAEIAPAPLLRPALAAVLRSEIDDLTALILDEIQHVIPEYSRPSDTGYMHAISRGVEEALHEFVDRIADPGASRARCERIHRALGRNEMLAGRSLDNLQRAYRIGARLSWRRFMTVGERARIPHRTLVLLGEEIISHIDALANLAADGYLDAQSASRMLAGRRRRLLHLLVSDPLVSARELEEAAAAAQWPLPSEVVIAVLDRPVAEFEVPPPVLLDGLADLDGGEPFVLVPAGPAIDWHRVFADRRIAVTGPVALHDAADALRWARRVLVLVRQGLLPDRPVTWCDDHLAGVLLLSDEALALELVKRQLGPLVELDPEGWMPLAETLLWWIRAGGEVGGIAAGLGTTAEQVRDRLGRLEPLFGAVLRDPDSRFELEMALRAALLLLGGK